MTSSSSTDMTPFKDIIFATEKLVQEEMAKYDPSHDWLHVKRVVNMAFHLAKEENVTDKDSLEIIHLAALLHDIRDDKYHQENQEGESSRFIVNFLNKVGYHKPQNIHKIMEIIDNMSFRKMHFAEEIPEYGIEFDIVGDSDRLDAIGSIGIARCMAFSGAKNRSLIDPCQKPLEEMTQHEYKTNTGTAANHFYEKLFLLKDMMRTATAKKVAEKRHRMMKEFLTQLEDEVDLKA